MLTLGDPGPDLWSRFEEGSAPDDDPVVTRWTRSARAKHLVSSKPIGLCVAASAVAERQARSAALLAAADRLLASAAEELVSRGCAVVVTDAEGVILRTYGVDGLEDRAARPGLVEGTRWCEAMRGTNGMGTALEEGTAVAVIGRAHFDPAARNLVCYSVPIRGVNGVIVAALDISALAATADPLLGVVVQSLGAAIEGALRVHAVEQVASQMDALRSEEAEARKLRDELASTLKLNETFLAVVAHELRGPLATVSMGADLLLARAHDAKQRRVASLVRSSGQRMSRMVEELFDLARARLGGGIPLLQRVGMDFGAVAERVVGELALAHPTRALDLTKKGDTFGDWDEVRIGQLVSNLITNAIRHGGNDSPIRVEIDGSSASSVVVTVTNEGEIPSDVRSRLFDPFEVSRLTRSREGLGLGLFIASRVAEAHRGTISVASRAGETVFRVMLPRHDGAANSWSKVPVSVG
ncbi:Sensory box histidine kinase [Labilithrix luteola]|uniref:histidine kinase n=1 Tax=Labilithrix luteola TaxID=1391654 RepID=A0A0K1Q6L3_9BACT|nr:HAMP domain-containing sensor histidine kinase [Labilithrix luteola]AKV01282.1 Sensory box histidine kinase [Labilithrix luteola]